MVLKYALPMMLCGTLTLRSIGMPATKIVVFQLPSLNVNAEKLGGLDPRQCVHASLNLVVEQLETRIVILVAGQGIVDIHPQHVLLVEARPGAAQVDERPQKEACSHHQHQRERNLRRYKFWPSGERPRRMMHRAALEARGQLQARGAESRQCPEEQRRATVTTNVKASSRRLIDTSSGMVFGRARACEENPIGRGGKSDAQRPSRQREHQAFVSSWRTIRHAPAPNACRTASSRARAIERASSRLAMLAQAISSTSATIPIRT